MGVKSIILPQTKKVPVQRLINISGSSSGTTYLLLAITLAIQIERLLLLKSPSKQINIYISLQLCIRILTKCQICDSYFGDLKCAYCQKAICSSCVSDNKTKCIKCNAVKRLPSIFLKSNIRYILLFVAIWFFVSGLYPFPYLLAIGVPIDFRIMQPVLIATGLMMIPFVFMMFAWKKRPPPG